MSDKPANATEALRELVACKDLKDRIDAAWDGVTRSVCVPDDFEAIYADYQRRKPLAWAAARAVLAEPPKEVAALIERLRELVACADLKRKLADAKFHEWDRLHEELCEREPAAIAAARAYLNEKPHEPLADKRSRK